MTGEHKPQGIFNVEKCVRYLRMVGVEVTDAMAQQWADSEKVSRFLSNIRKRKRDCVLLRCDNGHKWQAIRHARRNKKVKIICPECGRGPWSVETLWVEARDGTLRDYRPQAERWKPLPLFSPEAP